MVSTDDCDAECDVDDVLLLHYKYSLYVCSIETVTNSGAGTMGHGGGHVPPHFSRWLGTGGHRGRTFNYHNLL